MKYENALAHFGFGRYQKLSLLLLGALWMLSGFSHHGNGFLVYQPAFRCRNQSSAADVVIDNGVTASAENLTRIRVVFDDTCYIHPRGNLSRATDVIEWTEQLRREEKCKEFVYDASVMHSTLITRWSLVCDRRAEAKLLTTILPLGSLVGSAVVGPIADTFGRRVALLLSCLLLCAALVGQTLVRQYHIFLLVRTAVGAGIFAMCTVAFVMQIELTPKHGRTHVFMAFHYFSTASYATVATLGYFVRDIDLFLRVISLLGLLTAALCLVQPESPAWLIVRNRLPEAVSVFGRIARFNRTKFDSHVVRRIHDTEVRHECRGDGSVFDLIRTRTMRRFSFVLFFMWFTAGMTYYGLMWNISDVHSGGNLFLTYFIFAAIELAALLLTHAVVGRLGRRAFLMTSFSLGGFFLILAQTPRLARVAAMVFAGCGVASLCVTHAVLWVYASELMPTTVRSFGLGIGSALSRLGAMATPFVFLLAGVVPVLPMIVFGLFALTSGGLLFLLPETMDQSLLENVYDAKSLMDHGRPMRLCGCCCCCCCTRSPDHGDSVDDDDSITNSFI